jgi:hypothetical protein
MIIFINEEIIPYCIYDSATNPNKISLSFLHSVLPLRSTQCWNFLTVYRGGKSSRNTVVVAARQATQAGGIDSLESILGLLRSFKIRALVFLEKNPGISREESWYF